MTEILAMNDEELKGVGVTHYGDRVAIRVFCRNATADSASAVSVGEALICKIKSKLDGYKSAAARGSGGTVAHLTGNKFAKKNTRRVEVGWLHLPNGKEGVQKQVRARRGGGLRKLCVDCHTTVRQLKSVAEGLFFPGGTSPEGKINEFCIEMVGFDGSSIPFDSTLEEIYNVTKVRLLRVYMLTSRVTNSSNDTELPIVSTKRRAEHHPKLLVLPPPKYVASSTVSCPLLVSTVNTVLLCNSFLVCACCTASCSK